MLITAIIPIIIKTIRNKDNNNKSNKHHYYLISLFLAFFFKCHRFTTLVINA